VECYDESKIKQDLETKGFSLQESVKVEKMELYAYASDQDKRWMLFARPQQGMVEGAPPGEEMLCPLDAGEGGVEGMKQSRYYQKYFQAEAPGTSGASAP
jgi:hypothetical protein